MKESYANFKQFAKYAVLAQIASDAGKDMHQETKNNSNTAAEKGYEVKNMYLAYAVHAAKSCTGVVKVTQGDHDGVLYFDIKGFGQISYHTFKVWPNVPTTGKWSGDTRESRIVAAKLSKKLNLGVYKVPNQ